MRGSGDATRNEPRGVARQVRWLVCLPAYSCSCSGSAGKVVPTPERARHAPIKVQGDGVGRRRWLAGRACVAWLASHEHQYERTCILTWIGGPQSVCSNRDTGRGCVQATALSRRRLHTGSTQLFGPGTPAHTQKNIRLPLTAVNRGLWA